ncbi:hypothetical protein UB34_20455, partial [Photobacterium leiognathi]|uniref:hypothetical protein n=1 Tax=Photobacterium leiognathi TaxID=553611 RepID=UPI0005D3E375
KPCVFMFVNALCVSMGALSIITLKTTIHLKRKRLLPEGNNKHRERVYKERKRGISRKRSHAAPLFLMLACG